MTITIPVTFVWVMFVLIAGLIWFILGIIVNTHFEDDEYAPEEWK